ncbi:flagellar export protein FliJ [Paenibacillus polygoni]|uniref:Flagellar FliJ protein n=1 Tax=Paenibacillus polygoni TaxID=3050112 RepID=A0ABY8X6M0_9BACL|nr:flagellar export protein FliJ [Paenibacillus polygoni]WIV20779.1 flagellar export protein FliJ [Paenibacillus polygoni]
MGFTYHFQKVVDLKAKEKTQAEWLLSSAIGKLQAEENHLLELVRDRENLLEGISSFSLQSASASSLQEMNRYIHYLDECISRKNNDVAHAEVNVKQNQAFLNDKMLDEKVWNQAREKEKMHYQQEMLLKEQNELDEMATVRFAVRAR